MGFKLAPGEIYPYSEHKVDIINYIFPNKDSQLRESVESYLDHLKVDSFILDERYVDRDFLEDYAAFYASCFKKYKRFCKRILFFGKNKIESQEYDAVHESLSQPKYKNLLTTVEYNDASLILERNFLGFIVVRPFKSAKLGTTCLKTYPENNKRFYPVLKKYTAHIYGFNLEVESMAFLEQDKTVTVCASTALWSALQITGVVYKHAMPSPSTVTKFALSESHHIKKFPNAGLTVDQIAVGISKVGLEPMIIKLTSLRKLKAYVYSYASAGIPVVLGMSLFDTEKDENGELKITPRSKKYHAVTINGFSIDDKNKETVVGDSAGLYSSKIDMIYCHDDQLCPFARMKLTERIITDKGVSFEFMHTGWKNKNNNIHKIAKAEALIIPLYNKIRINFPTVYRLIQKIDRDIESALLRFAKIKSPRFEWDIKLVENWNYKSSVRKNEKYISSRSKILKKPLPKYIWKATSIDENNENIFEVLFDTTESSVRNSLLCYFCFDSAYEPILAKLLPNKSI